MVERTSRPKTFLRCNLSPAMTRKKPPFARHSTGILWWRIASGHGRWPDLHEAPDWLSPSIRCQWHDLVDVGPVNQTGLALAPSFSLLEVALQSTVALLCEL